jgi:hypothetical protein
MEVELEMLHKRAATRAAIQEVQLNAIEAAAPDTLAAGGIVSGLVGSDVGSAAAEDAKQHGKTREARAARKQLKLEEKARAEEKAKAKAQRRAHAARKVGAEARRERDASLKVKVTQAEARAVESEGRLSKLKGALSVAKKGAQKEAEQLGKERALLQEQSKHMAIQREKQTLVADTRRKQGEKAQAKQVAQQAAQQAAQAAQAESLLNESLLAAKLRAAEAAARAAEVAGDREMAARADAVRQSALWAGVQVGEGMGGY